MPFQTLSTKQTEVAEFGITRLALILTHSHLISPTAPLEWKLRDDGIHNKDK